MDNPPPPPITTGRTWFRLGSIARMEQPAPAPAPPPPQPQFPVGRPLIRPPQPPPTQPAPPPPEPQPTRLPTLGGTFSVSQSPQATRPAATGVSSVPASPRADRPVTAAPFSSSVPQSPARPPPTVGTSSMPQSPAKPQAGGSVSSLLQSPPRAKTTDGASSVPQSPAKLPVGGSAASLPQSPPRAKTAPQSPAKPSTDISTSPPRAKMGNSVGTSSVPQSPRVITAPSPMKSPKTIKQSSSSPPRTPNKNLGSPKTIKPATPPSPVQLPPSHLKADPEPELPVSRREPPPSPQQKAILLPQVQEKDRAVETNLHKQELTRHNARTHNRSWGGSEESSTGLRTVTIAGDNRGAYMELLSSSSSSASPWKGKGERTGQGEEAKKNKSSNDKAGRGGMAGAARSCLVNSNVQAVNNSILFNASCAHNSPGVHLALSRKLAARGRPQVDHADDLRHSRQA